MLPSFLIIGAPKCGTTSLHHYLRQHPDVWMPDQKELHLFSRQRWRERLDWYESCFEARTARGEASTSYSMHPAVPGVPARVHALIPEARLIYLVRDPIERLIAHHAEWVWRGFESRSLERSLEDLKQSNPYVCSSMYAAQLAEYRRFFPGDRLLVLEHRELLDSREETLATVFEFLGVDPTFWSNEFERVLNPRRAKVPLNRLGRTLARRRRVRRRLLGPAVRGGGPVARLAARALTWPAHAPIDAAMRRRLVDVFRPDADRLRMETGKSLATWTV